jgi:hypothetical protein
MAVGVDEPGNDRAALGVDHGVGIRVEPPAGRGDLPVGDHDAVGVEERAGDIARDDQADILDQRLHALLVPPSPCPLPLRGRGI